MRVPPVTTTEATMAVPTAGAARPTLSACVMTGGPAGRVGALLELLRPVVDELVVAIDDRADDATVAALADRADVTMRFAYREPVDRPLRWLYALCSSDWILNVDD